jgi:hypothetical protein
VARFAAALDTALAQENADYAAHRQAMRAPEVMAVAPGAFAAWMRHRGKAGGQNKVPRVVHDAALIESLRKFMREHGYVSAV